MTGKTSSDFEAEAWDTLNLAWGSVGRPADSAERDVLLVQAQVSMMMAVLVELRKVNGND